jgi:hypothetical protein
MRPLAVRLSPLLAALAVGVSTLPAQQINTGQNTGHVGSFGSPGGGMVGSPGSATFGQTFAAPAGYVWLDEFTFRLLYNEGPQFEFTAYVAAWDGVKASGPMLYASPLQTSPAEGAGSTLYTFSTGGIAVKSEETYVAFVNASPYAAAHPFPIWPKALAYLRQGGAGYSDSYGGGAFVYDANGSDFAALTARPWRYTGVQQYDLAFTAAFSVPEPSTVALVGTAVLLVGAAARRRTRVRLGAFR